MKIFATRETEPKHRLFLTSSTYVCSQTLSRSDDFQTIIFQHITVPELNIGFMVLRVIWDYTVTTGRF